MWLHQVLNHISIMVLTRNILNISCAWVRPPQLAYISTYALPTIKFIPYQWLDSSYDANINISKRILNNTNNSFVDIYGQFTIWRATYHFMGHIFLKTFQSYWNDKFLAWHSIGILTFFNNYSSKSLNMRHFHRSTQYHSLLWSNQV